MKSILLSLVLFAAVTASSAPAKFPRVLVLTGGGFQFAQFLGILDGLRETHGWEPDLVITTCGASYAGMLIHGMADPKDRLAFLKSEDFHNELRGIKTQPQFVVGWRMGGHLAGLGLRAASENPTLPVPQIFAPSTALDVPQEFKSEVTGRRFSPRGTRLLVVGSRVGFGPEDVGKPTARGSDKLYTEVYMTDEEVAPRLVGMTSPIAAAYPKSAVAAATEVRTDYSLGTAARVSISDLMYLAPAKIGDDYYAGGFVNLFPLELALSLGDEVVMLRSQPFSKEEQLIIRTTMGYDGNDRLKKVTEHSHPRVKWIATDGQGEMYAKAGLSPKFEPKGAFEPWLTTQIPPKLEDYAARVQAQYDWGFSRGKATPLK